MQAKRLRRRAHSDVPCLILFTRCPEPGQCKTRLIPSLGPAGALAVHEALLVHTVTWAAELASQRAAHVEIHFAGDKQARLKALCGAPSTWMKFRRQADGDLGERLNGAFDAAFARGYSRVAIIGTDCPALDPGLIEKAFDILQKHDMAIGPAADGGYYLIALRRHSPEIFTQIDWGSQKVLQATLNQAKRHGLSVGTLPVRSDVDRPEDLIELKQCGGDVLARLRELMDSYGVQPHQF